MKTKHKSELPILLVGNSLNRANNQKSWDDVLDKLRKTAKSPNCLMGDHKPYTIYFEELRNCAENNNVSINAFLAEFKEIFLTIGTSVTHKRLMDLNVAHILTTNYDYALECAITNPQPSKINFYDRWGIQESKYSLFRRNKAGSKWVWHIHGEALIPSSIMLIWASVRVYQ